MELVPAWTLTSAILLAWLQSPNN